MKRPYPAHSCPRAPHPKHRHAKRPSRYGRRRTRSSPPSSISSALPNNSLPNTRSANQPEISCLTWLRPAEAILRRLIFIEAHKLGENAPPAFSPRAGKRSARKRAASVFDPANPEAWRVTFRCSTPATRRPRAARPRRHAPSCQIFTRPLAARFEALLRAFNDPAPYALRLTRRLNPPGANRVQDEPPPNTRDLYGRELYDTLDFHYRTAVSGIDTG
ncbi:MAG: hypothetical protein HY055_07965 [Magnetospirillum sp.]|nr:hypothetical protein [Magnetospirillum sp.]